MSQREEKIRREPLHPAPVTRRALWFGLLGGGGAWTAHLLSAYFIAEFGCVSGLGAKTLLGMSLVAWLIIGMSAALLAIAVFAAIIARRIQMRLEVEPLGEAENAGTEFEIARTGFITSTVFAFIILVESAPIFFFLKAC